VTEVSPGATILRPEEALKKPASIGRPLTLTDVRILDRKGVEAPPGEICGIAIRGIFFNRYDRMPVETEEAVRNGFFRTGDTGRRDGEGFLYLVDRKADVIRKGGEELAEEELIAWCQRNLTDYKYPGRIHFVKEIPKTPAGKIVKAELHWRYAS
jgi:fatty-acyl-CoA synthase